ncbi:replication protein A 70 [Haematobia irritans]|uniref:replication protein A 70 n=1 Tax=Haematobia irritans TaxID=7368 RepID=UPI003F507EE8
MAGIASLSVGVLSRIMNGEMVELPVLQILGVLRVVSGESERIRIKISDSKYFNSFALLTTQLTPLFQGKLDKNCIVRLDQYVTTELAADCPQRRALIIAGMTVLHSGEQVKEQIGEPVSYIETLPPIVPTDAPNTNEENPTPSTSTSECHDASEMGDNNNPESSKPSNSTSLSVGVIARIMSGESVLNPVVQILGVKRMAEHLRIMISDSKYSNSYALLATQLNAKFNEENLKDKSIVRLDKYITTVVVRSIPAKRLLLILGMTVLNSGDQVKENIGDPVSYFEGLSQFDTTDAPNTSEPNSNSSTTFDSNSLSVGVIPRIMAGETVVDPVVQLLGVKRIGAPHNRWRIWISDGNYFHTFVMIATHLNSKFNEKNLKNKSIIRLDRYITSVVGNGTLSKRVLIILEMTILHSGDTVKEAIGKPVSYTQHPACSVPSVLSVGVIPRILNGEQVESSVLQVLGKMWYRMEGRDRMRLKISDSRYFYTFVLLSTQLTTDDIDDILLPNTIICVNNYITELLNDGTGRIVLTITGMSVRNTANEVAMQIGEPVAYSPEVSPIFLYNRIKYRFIRKLYKFKNFTSTEKAFSTMIFVLVVVIDCLHAVSMIRPVYIANEISAIYKNTLLYLLIKISSSAFIDNPDFFSRIEIKKFKLKPRMHLYRKFRLRANNTVLQCISYGSKMKTIDNNASQVAGSRSKTAKLTSLFSNTALRQENYHNNMPGIASLSVGVIPRIMAGEEVESPVFQILGVKRIAGGDNARMRLLISDSKYFNSYAMLATQLNPMFGEDKLKEHAIVRVDKYITSVVNKNDSGKRVLIILEMAILNPGEQVKQKIGEPVSYTEAASNASAPTTSASKPVENKPKPMYTNHNNNTLDQTINSGLTHPIASLSPYQNKWVIKVRVTAKSPLRTWSNAKGEGKLFSMDLMDDSGEIRATAFREQCDKYYDMIEVDKVYFISKCQLKPANKQFCTLKNDYEMTFTSDTVVQLCEDDDGGIPEVKYDLVPISQIANMEPKAAVDVVGVCKEVGELQVFTSRTTNKEFKKRDLTLVDTSDAAVTLTIWGDDAVNFDGHVQPIILVKGGRINEFNGGKSISMANGSVIKINPDIPEGHKLRGWFDNGGGANITNSVSARTGAGGGFSTEWRTFHEARNLGTGDKADYFQTKAVVHLVKSNNAYYKACPQAECNKKVIDENNGHYRCERCNAVFPNFKYRLLVNMSIGDWTSNRWVTCFSDIGEQLLGRSAQEIGEAMENNPAEAEEIFTSINFHSYIFKLRSKVENYGDMSRSKLTVQSATPVNFKEYNKYLINNLKELTGINKV